jgi:hypothetical protein
MTTLTGRTRYRTTWFTRRQVLQVEVLVTHQNVPDIGTFSEFEWRDAKVDDLARVATTQLTKEAA